MNTPIPGATTILSKLQVRNNPDLPVTDTNHVQGGAWSVADVATRNLIPGPLRLANVTRCYVEAEDRTYVLRGGIENDNWQPDLTGGGGGSGKGINKFVEALTMQVGTAFTFDLPADLFGPAPIAYAALSVQNLPKGLSLVAPARITGTSTEVDAGLLVVNATLTTGEHLQYVLGYKSVLAPVTPNIVGVVALDVSFGAMNPANLSELVYDFDLALQLNEPGLSLHGGRAVPGVSGRFIGTETVTGCLAVAAIAKQTVPGNAAIRFYRFGISVVKLRQLYPNQLQVRFDIRGARKGANPVGLGNAVFFRTGRDFTSGLLASGQPIGFESANPTEAGPPLDYTNQAGTGYAVGVNETLLAYLVVTLATGEVALVDVAAAPAAEGLVPIIYGDPILFDIPQSEFIAFGDPVAFEV